MQLEERLQLSSPLSLFVPPATLFLIDSPSYSSAPSLVPFEYTRLFNVRLTAISIVNYVPRRDTGPMITMRFIDWQQPLFNPSYGIHFNLVFIYTPEFLIGEYKHTLTDIVNVLSSPLAKFRATLFDFTICIIFINCQPPINLQSVDLSALNETR